MKGLIRNNFYSMESNIKISFILCVLLIFTPFLIKDYSVISMIISIQIFIFIANVGTSLQADESSKWNKFEAALPLSSNAIIMAKYISFFMLIVLGFTISVFTGIAACLSNPQLTFSSIIWGYEYGLTLSIIVAAIVYPIILKTGTEKSELIIILAAFISVALMLLIAIILSPITNGMHLRSTLVGTVSVVVSLLLLYISYLVSLRIYRNKEF